jgi:hypothetical protein
MKLELLLVAAASAGAPEKLKFNKDGKFKIL